MKRVNLFLLATVLLAVVACSKEEILDEIQLTEPQSVVTDEVQFTEAELDCTE
jgi:hypothetical protein